MRSWTPVAQTPCHPSDGRTESRLPDLGVRADAATPETRRQGPSAFLGPRRRRAGGSGKDAPTLRCRPVVYRLTRRQTLADWQHRAIIAPVASREAGQWPVAGVVCVHCGLPATRGRSGARKRSDGVLPACMSSGLRGRQGSACNVQQPRRWSASPSEHSIHIFVPFAPSICSYICSPVHHMFEVTCRCATQRRRTTPTATCMAGTVSAAMPSCPSG
ncbi:hypothetical protein K466DRAFT_224130 [Polyporus arcularius HHB13444]|uniref:Uncharacterized protein n=1 Tax=Polyporus arcularius HHB13444 TaxID=1314778 RepID=A0A5C3P4B8_9APHY|nr:hypothetical protein K466DRAFT_224130 [Polyporus arcularius HHB13444]